MIKKKKSRVKTKELCQLAVENDVYYLVLQYVPDELRTKELCDIAFSKNPLKQVVNMVATRPSPLQSTNATKSISKISKKLQQSFVN